MLWCMRTTLTLDDDVAVRLERLRRTRNLRFRQVVNEALREGLNLLEAPPAPGAPVRTVELELGRCLIGTVDDVGDALALAEGNGFR